MTIDGEKEKKDDLAGQDTDATLEGKPLFQQLWNAEFCAQGTAPYSQPSSFSLQPQRPWLLLTSCPPGSQASPPWGRLGLGPNRRNLTHHAGRELECPGGGAGLIPQPPRPCSLPASAAPFSPKLGAATRNSQTPSAGPGSRPPGIPAGSPQESSWGLGIGMEGAGEQPLRRVSPAETEAASLTPLPSAGHEADPALTQKTMLKPNRKYFPQQPTSGSWKCWCLPGMVSGHPPPREPEPGTGSALRGPPRPGAAPGLARRLPPLHAQGHPARRPPRPPWRRPRRSGHHTLSAVPSSDPASARRSGPAHGVSPRPSQQGSVFMELRPCPRPSHVLSSRSPAHAHDSAPSRV